MPGLILHPMQSSCSIFQSVCHLRSWGSSGRGGCLLGINPWEGGHCGVFFFWNVFLVVCVAGRVGEGFANFQGKASGFPASQSISQIDCLGFVSGEFARLVAEVFSLVVGHNFAIKECSPQKLCQKL